MLNKCFFIKKNKEIKKVRNKKKGNVENNWYQAQFNHDVTSFTLTPSHVPLPCTDCHLDQTNYKEYSCISCHTHNKQITDEQHIRVHHYKYVSSACRMCHPAHENHHGKY